MSDAYIICNVKFFMDAMEKRIMDRLDAIEAAKGHSADARKMVPRELRCPTCSLSVTGRTWNWSCPQCGATMVEAPPQPSGNTGELKESVGERIAKFYFRSYEIGYVSLRDAINAAVAEANARVDAANHEVRMASQNRDKWKDAFDVLREDHNALCDGMNSALDAHGIKWKDNSTYAGFMESALDRAEKAEAEVKRLRDPGWIEQVPYLSEIRLCFREHFARHAEARP